MAQQRMLVGTIIPILPDCGDETHPVFVRDGQLFAIETVAEADKANRLGDVTVGGPTTPFYLKDGVPTPLEGGIGTGTNGEVALGDGTLVSVEKFISDHIDIIREKLGIVTKEHNGLVPKLPDIVE